MVRVLIVDDYAAVREGLRSLLELQEGIEVVGEGADGLEAVEQARRLVPDVVLMDLAMPKMDGIEATKRIRAQNPLTQVIILTSFSEEGMAAEALEAGVSCYLLKNVSPNCLVKAVRSVQI